MFKRIQIILIAIVLFAALMGIFVAFKVGLKNEPMLEELKNGNYEHLNDDNVKRTLQQIIDQQAPEIEWIYYDLNSDGQMELILQEKEYVADKFMKRIIGVFAIQNSYVSTVIWDVGDVGAFYFLYNNKLFYYYQYYGIYDYESYQVFQFDMQWNEKLLEGYEYYYIYNVKELSPAWLEDHPTITKEGVYYKKYSVEDVDGTSIRMYEDITERQWKEFFNNSTLETD